MKDNLLLDELEALAEENVGEALRRTRIYYKKTLADVEIALRVRASQIDAIEKGDMNALPGRVYAIGFVRSYAEYMQLDGAKVVELFKAQYMDGNAKAALSFPVPASETKLPSIWIATLCLVLLSGLVLILKGGNQNDRSFVETIEDVPDDIIARVSRDIITKPPQEAMDSTVFSSVENMSEGDAIPQKTGIVLNILGDSWIEIKNDAGDILVSNILTEGDEYFVPDSPGLSMSLGNAANVEILVGGLALKPLGKDGEVRKGIPLNLTYLQTLAFVEPELDEESLDNEISEELSLE